MWTARDSINRGFSPWRRFIAGDGEDIDDDDDDDKVASLTS